MIALARARKLAVTALALLIALVAALAVPAEAEEHKSGDVQLRLVSVSPARLTTSSVLTLEVRISNATDKALTGAVATLSVNRRVSQSRTVLENWATARDDAGVGQSAASIQVPTVAAQSTDTITLEATPAQLGLTARSDWGPRGVAVVLSQGNTRVDVLRTFAVWTSAAKVTPVRVSVLAPVTGPPVTRDMAGYDAQLASVTSDAGRLGKVLAATADLPFVSWVVDPALLSAASTSANGDVRAWSSRLVAAAEGRSVATLPAYDPDPAAYAHAGLPWPTSTPLAAPGAKESNATPTAGPSPGTTPAKGSAETSTPFAIPTAWRADLAWPATGEPDLATTQLAAASGRPYVVVGGGAMAPDDDLTYTPTAVTAVPRQNGTVAVVADRVLTEQVGAAQRDTAPGSSSSDSPALRTQRLLAETAVIARERPNDQRDVLIAPTRSWDPDPDTTKAELAALAGAAWVRMTTLDEVLSTTPDSGHRASLPPLTSNTHEISAGQLAALANDANRLTQFAAIAEDPAALIDGLRSAFVSPASIAFRSAPNARNDAVAGAGANVDAIASAVTVAEPSTFNLLSEKSNLPITVRNGLDQPVTVTVSLTSDNTRLDFTSAPTLTIAAHGQAEAKISTHAIGTGNVRVTGTLSGPSGPISEPFTFKVRVRAKWETVGTAVMGTVLGVLFLGGIWRTVRRGGRSERRVAGSLANQPALPDTGPTPSGLAGRTEE